MRTGIIRILAAAGLALATVPAGADPGARPDPFVGPAWDQVPHAAAPQAQAARQGLAVGDDAFVGARWNDTPSAGASPQAAAAAKPGPASPSADCRCVARAR